MTDVGASSSHHSSKSFEETSALLPTETKPEKAELPSLRLLEEREAQRAALGREPDVPRGKA